MSEPPDDPVLRESLDANKRYFLKNIEEYKRNIETLDTYVRLRGRVSEKLSGIGRMLDIGNGGVFDYDASRVGEIVALDLFFDKLPPDLPAKVFPPNARAKTGSALDIPEPDGSFDAVLMVMLIHHLVGRTVADCRSNARRAIGEASRVLKPGGRFILVESCVPRWFYGLERLAYRPSTKLLPLLSSHPPTLQYAADDLRGMVAEFLPRVEVERVPLGRHVMLHGVKVPSVLTPVQVHILEGRKEEAAGSTTR